MCAAAHKSQRAAAIKQSQFAAFSRSLPGSEPVYRGYTVSGILTIFGLIAAVAGAILAWRAMRGAKHVA